MAYEGYRGSSNPSDQHQVPYQGMPGSYDSIYDHRSYQSPSYGQHYAQFPAEPQSPRSRASSNTRSDGSQQPLYDAVNNAFDNSDAASRVDPALIAQITEQVRKQVLDSLKSTGLGATAAAQPPPPPPPPQQQQYVPQSPTASTTTSIPTRNVYTPPSPVRHDFSSHGSNSPDPLHDSILDGNDDTPTPRYERNQPTQTLYEKTSRQRPAIASRQPTEAEVTTVEKIWQPLFDPNGEPTPRLGQFLRGLAIHIIEDYEPVKSLVIPPEKMERFYDDVKLPDEVYPWSEIFGKLPNVAISKIYRDLRCEHHLIQDRHTDSPQIPALTPNGFNTWMSIMIQAHPNAEYKRLSKAVLAMPINNADNCRERFPKELPSRLFLKEENLQAQQRCAAALSADGAIQLRKAPSFPPPPPIGVPTQSPERERHHSSQTEPANSDVDDDDNDDGVPISMPLERERKPYVSAPGSGKMYDGNNDSSLKSDSELHTRHHRSQSSTTHNNWPPSNGKTADYIPASSSRHYRTGSHLNGRRARSPNFSNYGTRSDTNIGDIPPYYSTSNIYDSEDDNRKFALDADSKRSDWARRQAEDDAPGHRRSDPSTGSGGGAYASQPRLLYDDEYYSGRNGSNGYDSKSYGGQYLPPRY
ncbi:hypothetical protein AOQ84DRAFT_114500 [Glonium stellatum]|uniref:DUF7514 domain-containing protein n=1 Tax=Glonium stellatum TaxID=574774 RepID=A0A8E2FA03_9PEZI|nr:hypothetical protein AOQ84DRAFT_114500 [Glonium stellatum]